MTVSEKIFQLLLTTTTKVYPVYAPQGTTVPFMVYDITSVTPNKTKGTASKVDEVVVRVSCFDLTLAAATGSATAVRTALDNKRDVANGFDRITFLSEQSDFDEESQYYYYTQDFTVRQWK
jgi:hypothetical protein